VKRPGRRQLFFFEKRTAKFFPFGAAQAGAMARQAVTAQAQNCFASFFKKEELASVLWTVRKPD
jgi:hypothetical protein